MEASSATVQVHGLQVHGLQKSYDKLHVLKGVDFDVARGSIFALLGSNGAGKTTIVRILTTLLKPDSGTASVNEYHRSRELLHKPAGQGCSPHFEAVHGNEAETV